MIIFCWKTRLAAFVLAVFTAAAAMISHDFWTLSGREQINQMLHAFKNVSMIGGLMILYGAGPGPLSVERWYDR